MPKGLLQGCLHYGTAVLSVAIALLIGWLTPLNQFAPTSLFFAAVMISSWYGGLWPGLLSTALSVVAIDFLLIDPAFALTLDLGDLVRMAVFVLEALLISGLNGKRKGLELSLQRRNDELLAAHRYKDAFLATLGHELRTPLAPIYHGVHLVRLRCAGDTKVEQICEIAERQVRHMSRIVDDLLDVSRIGRGKVALERQPVSLAVLVGDAVAATRPLFESHRHALTLALPSESIWLNVDATRIEQVLVNLLSNAAKYTPSGGNICLAVECDKGDTVLRVRDNGLGITPKMLPHIFEPFMQAERVIDRSEGGLGIGLSLVKGLVELHGGTVSAASAGPGRGSEFTVRLPSACVPAPQRVDAESALQRTSDALRVLVVDDSADAAQLLCMLLETWGHRVAVAHDGEAALERVVQFNPEVVLLDLSLPRMNGYQVAERIGEMSHRGRMLLIALTGHGMDEDFRRTRAAGFDHHLLKPLDMELLESLLTDFAATRPRPLVRPVPR